MLVEKKRNLRNAQAGVTLIELMISIALGLLLLGAATAMTVSSMVMNGDTLKSARLNQDFDSVLQVMVNDIRRAGYSGAVPGFFPDDYQDVYIEDPDNEMCLLYAYDSEPIPNGVLNDTDKFGFKLSGTEIEMRISCSGSNLDCSTDCDAGDWVALTDNDVIVVIAPDDSPGLKFDSVNSKCLNITHEDNEVIPGNKNNFWVTTTDDTSEFPCTDSTTANLTNYVIQTDGTYATGTFVAPQTGDRLIEVRQVNVALQGELKNDDTMLKSQEVAINIRNNRVTIQ